MDVYSGPMSAPQPMRKSTSLYDDAVRLTDGSLLPSTPPRHHITLNNNTPNVSNSSSYATEEELLGRFRRAKEKINGLFDLVGAIITDTARFLTDLNDEPLANKECCTQITGFLDQIHYIKDMIARDQMKVAFFGRTSSGKSSVCNAILGNKILPVGMGDTTNCFITMQGTLDQEPYMIHPLSLQPQSVQSVAQLAHALDKNKLQRSSQLAIFWPKDKAPLLRHDLMFIDSPGISVDIQLDSWIDKYCLDADVFIFVANAESTIMEAEKQFFHKVAMQLSRPNLFILQNKWDLSEESDVDCEAVRQQHVSRSAEFLVKELCVCDSMEEAMKRIFFISAKEELNSRLALLKGTQLHYPDTPGFLMRRTEFDEFEKAFQESVSESAIRTKFEKHTDKGLSITSEVKVTLTNVKERAFMRQQEKKRIYEERKVDMRRMKQQLKKLCESVARKIHQTSGQTEAKVATSFSEEIARLSTLLEEFRHPFDSDAAPLKDYRKAMFAYVEEGLRKGIEGRCAAYVLKGFDDLQKEMISTVTSILPSGWITQSRHNPTAVSMVFAIRPPPRLHYGVTCQNLCAEFREDLDFHFSLGLKNLLYKLIGPAYTRKIFRGISRTAAMAPRSIPRPISSPEQGDDDLPLVPSSEGASDDMMLPILTTLVMFSSKSPVGLMVAGGLLWKLVDWRLIALLGGVYVFIYSYEKLTWNKAAKERAYKEQFVEYASRQLQGIVSLLSTNAASQIESELEQIFAGLKREVEAAIVSIDREIQTNYADIEALDEVRKNAKYLHNKIDFQEGELKNFADNFLKKR